MSSTLRMAFDSNHNSKEDGYHWASSREKGKLPIVILVRPTLDRCK